MFRGSVDGKGLPRVDREGRREVFGAGGRPADERQSGHIAVQRTPAHPVGHASASGWGAGVIRLLSQPQLEQEGCGQSVTDRHLFFFGGGWHPRPPHRYQ